MATQQHLEGLPPKRALCDTADNDDDGQPAATCVVSPMRYRALPVRCRYVLLYVLSPVRASALGGQVSRPFGL